MAGGHLADFADRDAGRAIHLRAKIRRIKLSPNNLGGFMRSSYIKLLGLLLMALPSFSSDLQVSDLYGWYEVVGEDNVHHAVHIEEDQITVERYPAYYPLSGEWTFEDGTLTINYAADEGSLQMKLWLQNLRVTDLQKGVYIRSTEKLDDSVAEENHLWIRKVDVATYRLADLDDLFAKAI